MRGEEIPRETIELARRILEIGPLCRFCLGSFAAEAAPRDVEEWVKGAALLEILGGPEEGCLICGGLIEKRLRRAVEDLMGSLREYEFDTFKAGSRIPGWIVERADEVRSSLGIETARALKVVISRYVDRVVSEGLGKEIDPDQADLRALVDLGSGRVSIEVKPVLVAGRYRKLVRGIWQSRRPCPSCGGRGCPECGWRGVDVRSSVETLIGEVMKRFFEAEDYRLHAAGREDYDARMLGSGRPFVMELVRPKVRRVSLREVERTVNEEAGGAVEVSGLRYADWELVEILKSGATETRKVYRAVVEVEGEVTPSELSELKRALSGAIVEQRTPTRVLRRRADLLRKRRVYSVETRLLGPRSFEMIVECDGGLYIKELVSGDDGRTRPSVSSILGKKAFCRELDVLEVKTPHL